VPSAGTRIAHVLWHEAGVAALVAGRIIGVGTLVTVGGGMFVGSILWMAGVIVWQVRGSQHRRWDAQPAAYLVALSLLAAGAVLGVLLTTVPPAGGYGAHVS
jgi:hypothetical protein